MVNTQYGSIVRENPSDRKFLLPRIKKNLPVGRAARPYSTLYLIRIDLII